jgi:U3 small nucleolar ribonucleoprotein protein IMP4
MNRRQTRLRREYLYRKAIESKDRLVYEKKQSLKNALEEGKRIPSALATEAAQLQKELMFDQDQQEPTTTIDDEYQRAGEVDPKILVTTSRDPSSRLTQFAKVSIDSI